MRVTTPEGKARQAVPFKASCLNEDGHLVWLQPPVSDVNVNTDNRSLSFLKGRG